MNKQEFEIQKAQYIEMYNNNAPINLLQRKLKVVDFYYGKWMDELEEDMKENGKWWADEQ